MARWKTTPNLSHTSTLRPHQTLLSWGFNPRTTSTNSRQMTDDLVALNPARDESAAIAMEVDGETAAAVPPALRRQLSASSAAATNSSPRGRRGGGNSGSGLAASGKRNTHSGLEQSGIAQDTEQGNANAPPAMVVTPNGTLSRVTIAAADSCPMTAGSSVSTKLGSDPPGTALQNGSTPNADDAGYLEGTLVRDNDPKQNATTAANTQVAGSSTENGNQPVAQKPCCCTVPYPAATSPPAQMPPAQMGVGRAERWTWTCSKRAPRLSGRSGRRMRL